MADYEPTMGTRSPGARTVRRNTTTPPSAKEMGAKSKEYAHRSGGESRRDNTAGRGTSQGDNGSKTKRGTIA